MPREPLVDVIIPAYNASRFLRAAVDSALSQDGVPLRVIVIDDGSTDDTAAIARSYGDPVLVISQENKGLPGARNSGLSISTAPYVALLDADDIWRHGKLARQVAVLRDHPEVGLVFTDMTIFKGEEEIVEDGFLLATPRYAELPRTPLGDDAVLLPESLVQGLMRENFISPSTVMLRREAIIGVGGFDEAFRVCEDAECWLRTLWKWRAIAIEERLVLSRYSDSNLSTQAERMLRGRLQIGQKVLAHPEFFPPGAPAYFTKERPVCLYRLGRVALEAGEVLAARRLLVKSLKEKPSWVAGALLGMAFLGPRSRRVMFRIKRAAGLRVMPRVE